MQDVKRKAPRSNSKTVRIVIAALALVGTAVVCFLLLKPPHIPPVPPSRSKQVLLLTAPQEHLRSFTAWPTRAAPYTVKQQDGVLQPAHHPGFVFDQRQQEIILNTLSYLEALDDFGPLELMPGETLEDFGLGEKAFMLEADYAQGKHIKLAIGNRVQGELPLDYLMVDGSDHLYAISADIRDTFDRPVTQLHVVPPINLNPELINRVSISGPRPFSMRRLEHQLWQMQRPFPYPANTVLVQKLLKQLASMRLAAYVEAGDAAALARYGLDKPAMVADVHLVESTLTSLDEAGQVIRSQDMPAETVTLAFGDPVADTGWYVLYQDTIYQASDLSLGFLMDTDWHRFASHQPIDIPLSTVSQLKVRQGETTKTFDVSLTEQVLPNNQLLRDDMGDLLYDFLITKDGQEVWTQQVTKPYLKLMEIKALGSLPENFVAEGEALLTLDIIAKGYRRQISFYPYDALHAAMGVDGVFLHFIDRALLNEIAF